MTLSDSAAFVCNRYRTRLKDPAPRQGLPRPSATALE